MASLSLENTAEQTLTFYKDRLSNLEQEHEDYLARIAAVEPKQEELHKQRYKIREQMSQISLLQKALSDANVNVDVEREEAAHLKAEVLWMSSCAHLNPEENTP